MVEKQKTNKIHDFNLRKNHFNEINKRFEKDNGKNNHLISIIIPLYNEEQSIKDVINKIPNHSQYEIIVVDDGSTDNSVKKVQEIIGKEVKIITHEKNQGYGAAVLAGIKHATGDIIVTIDSDGQHNPEEIPDLIEPIINNQADLVIGSRYLGTYDFKIPIYTKMGEIMIRLFLWILFRQKIFNSQNGFRVFKRKIKYVFNELKYKGMGFSTEVLFNTAYRGFKIKEVPITAKSRKYGDSYVNVLKTLKSVCSLILYYCFKKYNINLNKFFFKKLVDKIYIKINHLRFFQ